MGEAMDHLCVEGVQNLRLVENHLGKCALDEVDIRVRVGDLIREGDHSAGGLANHDMLNNG